jgi:hypothetical protein
MLRMRTTAGLLLATGACLLVLHLLGQRPALSPAVGGGARLLPGGTAEVDWLIVERGGQRLELRRSGKTWQVSQPFAAGADSVAVLKLLDAIERAPVRDRFTLKDLERRALDLGDLGLAPPQARIVIGSPSRRVELQLGAALPSAREIYVSSDQAARTVWVTDRDLLAAVPDSLDRMRERTLWRETQSRVTAIELRRPGMPFVKLIRDGEEWQMVQPFTARAHGSAVARALDALRAVRIERFVWPTGAEEPNGGIRTRLAYYGLDGESGIQVQLWESGNPVGIRLLFGHPIEENPGWVYALTPGDASVVAVSQAVLQPLMIPPSELRDNRLLPVPPDRVTRLTMQIQSQTLTFAREPEQGWTLTTPVRVRADAAAMGRLLQGVTSLRADRVLDADPVARATDDEPLASLDVTAGDSEWRLTITPSPAEPGFVHVVFTNKPSLFVVATTNLPLPLIRADGVRGLLDRTLLAAPAASVRRLTVKRGNEVWSVQRAANGDGWESAAGREPDPEAIQSWLTALAACQAEWIEAIGAAARDVAAFGMEEPWMEATIEAAADEPWRRVLLIGRETGAGNRFAMLRGHEVIYLLGPDLLRLLETPPAR